MNVRLESLGCRLNAAEMEGVAHELVERGHHLVGAGDSADVCVLNSCAVTSVSAATSRRMLRRLRRSHPGATLVATGCLAELAPAEIAQLGADLMVGNRDKDRLPSLLAELDPLARAQTCPERSGSPTFAGTRTRSFLKIQDGCDLSCTYCVVTIARGDSRSLAPDEVVRRVSELCARGYREVVLCGVHLGSYGSDRDDRGGLEGLVHRLLAETDVPRLRLSSLEPWDLEPSFFSLLASPRLLPHLHLPLQSGCDATLRRMGRRTDRASYAQVAAAARAVVPEVAISTDVMVGFPGESPSEFRESLAFVSEMAFSRLHVFRYSPRPGTAAADLPGRVPQPLARERSRRMLELGRRLGEIYRRRFVGRRVQVLWESSITEDAGRTWRGLSEHYQRVVTRTAADTDLANRITEARIVAATDGALRGEVVE